MTVPSEGEQLPANGPNMHSKNDASNKLTQDLKEAYAITETPSNLAEMTDGQVEELNADLHKAKLSDVQMKLVGEEPLFDEAVEKEGCEKILAALTEDEKKHLADPNMPLRHFRAEKGNVDAAITKIKATIAWRKEFGVDKIKTCFDEDGDLDMRKIISFENEPGKIYVRGYDKEGRAIVYMRPARENSKDEVNQMRHLVYQLERAIACTGRKCGKEKYNLVIDYDGFKLRNAPPLSTSKFTLTILQNHYPERLHRAYLCNPPVLFRTFWTVIKPFVDPVTKEKIVFCHGKAGLKKLEENFDLSLMEKCAGGTKDVRSFDSKEYLSTPLYVTFDEDAYK